jgi:very-short-patch-repair endonuclease
MKNRKSEAASETVRRARPRKRNISERFLRSPKSDYGITCEIMASATDSAAINPMLTYYLDFYCYDAKLNIEVDGEQHEPTKERDSERDHKLSVEGIFTVRFSSLRVLSEMPNVLQEIQEMCRQRTGKEPKFRNRD